MDERFHRATETAHATGLPRLAPTHTGDLGVGEPAACMGRVGSTRTLIHPFNMNEFKLECNTIE